MDLDQTDFSALLAGEERAWSRFILNARPVLEAAVHRTFARQGLKPDAGLFQDAISASLERLTADDFALLRRFDPGRGSIRAFSLWSGAQPHRTACALPGGTAVPT